MDAFCTGTMCQKLSSWQYFLVEETKVQRLSKFLAQSLRLHAKFPAVSRFSQLVPTSGPFSQPGVFLPQLSYWPVLLREDLLKEAFCGRRLPKRPPKTPILYCVLP